MTLRKQVSFFIEIENKFNNNHNQSTICQLCFYPKLVEVQYILFLQQPK